MYSGIVLWMIGTNLWLGTTLSLAVSILTLLLALSFRIRIEEKTLLAELDGYKEYSEKVKARIIPLIF
jgi:protein-S-isoprenylcysteine O-methyltransferase Ste14